MGSKTYVGYKLLHRRRVGVKPIYKFHEVGYERRVLVVQLEVVFFLSTAFWTFVRVLTIEE
jgi:K+ transporter